MFLVEMRGAARSSWMVLLGALLAAPAARAEGQQAYPGIESKCKPAYQIDFPTEDVGLDLQAVSTLAEAANWVQIGAGRSLRVLVPDHPLGPARAREAMWFLYYELLDPRVIIPGTFQQLTPRERYAVMDPGTVVILTCEP